MHHKHHSSALAHRSMHSVASRCRIGSSQDRKRFWFESEVVSRLSLSTSYIYTPRDITPSGLVTSDFLQVYVTSHGLSRFDADSCAFTVTPRSRCGPTIAINEHNSAG